MKPCRCEGVMLYDRRQAAIPQALAISQPPTPAVHCGATIQARSNRALHGGTALP
jgi:hypothetical protein